MVKIFVGNIGEGVTDDELRDLFAEYGKVTECDVLGSYGFVHMDKDAEAEAAIEKLDKHTVHGQPINVEKSSSGGKRSGGGFSSRGGDRGIGRGGGGFRGGFRSGPPMGGGGGDFGGPRGGDNMFSKSARRAGCTKLHVANFPDGMQSNELRRLFERYGFVAECDVVEEKKIAFVHIEDAAADSAINGLNNYNVKGVPLKVQMSKNQRREGNTGGSMLPPPRGGMPPPPRPSPYAMGMGASPMGGGRGRGRGGGMAAMRAQRMQAMSTDYGMEDYSGHAGASYGIERPHMAPLAGSHLAGSHLAGSHMAGANGDGYGSEPPTLPPPAKDRLELLDLLDRRRRLEALDPYERRLITCPDPFNLPPPTPEYLRLLRERALVKSRLPMPPSASKLSASLPTAGTTPTSNSLTRAIIARRVAAAAATPTVNAYNSGSSVEGGLAGYVSEGLGGYGTESGLSAYSDVYSRSAAY